MMDKRVYDLLERPEPPPFDLGWACVAAQLRVDRFIRQRAAIHQLELLHAQQVRKIASDFFEVMPVEHFAELFSRGQGGVAAVGFDASGAVYVPKIRTVWV